MSTSFSPGPRIVLPFPGYTLRRSSPSDSFFFLWLPFAGQSRTRFLSLSDIAPLRYLRLPPWYRVPPPLNILSRRARLRKVDPQGRPTPRCPTLKFNPSFFSFWKTAHGRFLFHPIDPIKDFRFIASPFHGGSARAIGPPFPPRVGDLFKDRRRRSPLEKTNRKPLSAYPQPPSPHLFCAPLFFR